MGMKNTCARFQGPSQKRPRSLGFFFVRRKWVRYVISLKKINGFSVGSSFFARCCLIMSNSQAGRISDFWRENFYRYDTCLGVRPTESCKMRRIFFSPPLGKSRVIIEIIEGLSLVKTSFAPRDGPPRPLKNKLAEDVTLFHWSWGSAWHQTFTLLLDIYGERHS